MKTLIFDMDDTLANTTPIHKKSFKECFLNYNCDIDTIPLQIQKNFFGKTMEVITQEILDYFKLDLDVETFLKKREKLVLPKLKEVKGMPGFEELIKFLREYKGKKAIATSSRQVEADTVIDALQIRDLFDVIVTSKDITKSKPDPDIFLKAANNLGSDPTDCIVFEDSDNGITAAKAAGMLAVGIPNSMFNTHQSLNQADIILKDLSEIQELVEKKEKKEKKN